MNGREVRLKYSHEALADYMITNPQVKHGELAIIFERTPAWISTIINSKSFQMLLQQRRDTLVDPVIRATLEERINTLASLSTEVLLHKLSKHPEVVEAQLALQVFEKSSKALGYGLRPEQNTQVNNNFVVAMPEKASSEDDWKVKYQGGTLEAGKQTQFPVCAGS